MIGAGRRRERGAFALGWLCASMLVGVPATAGPQISTGLTVGGGASELRAPSPIAAFHLGVRGELLFLRKRDGEWALGPYAELVTRNFDTLEVGGGLAVLVPVSELFPLVLSAGPHMRASERLGWQPGVATTLFFGSRSFNYHSVYGMAVGLFAQGRFGVGDSKQVDVLGGLQIDLQILALPFLYLVNAFR